LPKRLLDYMMVILVLLIQVQAQVLEQVLVQQGLVLVLG
jgi:hypothetical protein